MTKKFLSGFEREILQELAQEYECPKCLEPITNPLCHSCLGKDIINWISLYPSVKKMLPKIKNLIIRLDNEAEGSVNCISCTTKKAALCPYCFTESIFNLLKKNKVDKMLIMDFLSTFNFDLKHEGYIQDAAKEGLY
jgi:hypothetical protein